MLGLTNFDLQCEETQLRIANALERIAKVLEGNTCNKSSIGHNKDSNIHPGHEPQTGTYDH